MLQVRPKARFEVRFILTMEEVESVGLNVRNAVREALVLPPPNSAEPVPEALVTPSE
jgi:hypothetical protein